MGMRTASMAMALVVAFAICLGSVSAQQTAGAATGGATTGGGTAPVTTTTTATQTVGGGGTAVQQTAPAAPVSQASQPAKAVPAKNTTKKSKPKAATHKKPGKKPKSEGLTANVREFRYYTIAAAGGLVALAALLGYGFMVESGVTGQEKTYGTAEGPKTSGERSSSGTPRSSSGGKGSGGSLPSTPSTSREDDVEKIRKLWKKLREEGSEG